MTGARGANYFEPVLVPQTEDYDVSTEKCYVKFMLPKRPKNYTKFATIFFNMGLPPPPPPPPLLNNVQQKLRIWNAMASLSRLTTTLLNFRKVDSHCQHF